MFGALYSHRPELGEVDATVYYLALEAAMHK